MLSLLNVLFFLFHDLMIVINLFGWMIPATRRLQRVTLGATLFSWLVMGAWYGWGYCACTDWHFQIRRNLGIHGNESSYTQLLLKQLIGHDVSRPISDAVTLSLMGFILVGTTWMWVREYRQTANRTPAPAPVVAKVDETAN